MNGEGWSVVAANNWAVSKGVGVNNMASWGGTVGNSELVDRPCEW